MSAKEAVLDALEVSLRDYFSVSQESVDKRNISRWTSNYLTQPPTATPAIYIISGESTPEVQDVRAVRYSMDVDFDILVKVDKKADTYSRINAIASEIEKFCDTASLPAVEFLHIDAKSTSKPQLYDRGGEYWVVATVGTVLRYVRQRVAA